MASFLEDDGIYSPDLIRYIRAERQEPIDGRRGRRPQNIEKSISERKAYKLEELEDAFLRRQDHPKARINPAGNIEGGGKDGKQD